MQRSGLVVAVLAVLAISSTAVRADPISPFDVRTVPAAQTPSAATSVSPPAIADDVVIDHGKTQRRAALWTAVGGGALIAGSITLSFVEGAEYRAAVARGDADAASHARTIARDEGTALFLGGAVALGVAAALYVTAPKLRERHVIVAPIAGADRVGVAFGGGF